MLKISKWFYSDLHEVSPNNVFQEPENEQSKWRKWENEGWLKARGLDFKGSAAELRSRVRSYMDKPNEIPPKLSDLCCDVYDVEIDQGQSHKVDRNFINTKDIEISKTAP